jgi:N-glycosylase/DNA lyase
MLRSEALMEVEIKLKEPFDLAATLDSGQAFRWYRTGKGYAGVVEGDLVFVSYNAGALRVGTPGDVDKALWAHRYFDVGTDYDSLCESLKACDPTVQKAVLHCPGLRLLRQDPWETLISFICSANNNIPRIKQMVEKLAHRYGEPVTRENVTWWTFATPGRLSQATVADLEACGSGYRARGLLEAAQKVMDGRLVLDEVKRMPTEDARKTLMSLYGVGRKVADCVLLFGLGKLDAFPIDVWIKRGLEHNYFAGEEKGLGTLREFADGHFIDAAGYAQNFLFYYVRTTQKPERIRKST